MIAVWREPRGTTSSSGRSCPPAARVAARSVPTPGAADRRTTATARRPTWAAAPATTRRNRWRMPGAAWDRADRATPPRSASWPTSRRPRGYRASTTTVVTWRRQGGEGMTTTCRRTWATTRWTRARCRTRAATRGAGSRRRWRWLECRATTSRRCTWAWRWLKKAKKRGWASMNSGGSGSSSTTAPRRSWCP